jgi:hypothetical protein
MKAYFCVWTCDRCAKQERIPDHGTHPATRDELSGRGWAEIWPAQAMPLGLSPAYGTPAHVCPDCLTLDELEQLAQFEEEHAGDIPF